MTTKKDYTERISKMIRNAMNDPEHYNYEDAIGLVTGDSGIRKIIGQVFNEVVVPINIDKDGILEYDITDISPRKLVREFDRFPISLARMETLKRVYNKLKEFMNHPMR